MPSSDQREFWYGQTPPFGHPFSPPWEGFHRHVRRWYSDACSRDIPVDGESPHLPSPFESLRPCLRVHRRTDISQAVTLPHLTRLSRHKRSGNGYKALWPENGLFRVPRD